MVNLLKGRNNTLEKKYCTECKKNKRVTDFYNSNNPMFDGKSPICKPCMWDMVNYDDIETVYRVLKLLDIPFIYEYWQSAIETGTNVLGAYIRMANTLHQFRGLTWKDSIFDNAKTEGLNVNVNEQSKQEFSVTKELLEKWGHGYEAEEYLQFERKYQSLKNHYPERTAMHTEALLTYIRYRVKEEIATAKGDAKSAKDWGGLAKDAATAAKINPSQLSKADLSDGLDSFSQLVRSVEQAVDVIEILPKFKNRPQDKGDFTLWCYVNYIRDLKGLPLVEYKEIYKFYDDRKREYEMNAKDDQHVIL